MLKEVYKTWIFEKKSGNTAVATIALAIITIGSMHLSESGTIAAFRGEKENTQLDDKGDVFNTFNLFQHA